MAARENDLKRNGSGCLDPTFYEAVKNSEKTEKSETRYPDLDDARFHKLLDTIFAICELSGFHIEERIVIKDKKTGKIWR